MTKQEQWDSLKPGDRIKVRKRAQGWVQQRDTEICMVGHLNMTDTGVLRSLLGRRFRSKASRDVGFADFVEKRS